MKLSKGVKALYKIFVDNEFQPMSPQDLASVSEYKTVNSIDQILKRHEEYFTIQGKPGNRIIVIPKKHKKFAILIRDKFHCVYCNQQVMLDTATLDHINPDKNDNPSNLATSCSNCNNKKGDLKVNRFINEKLPEDRREIAKHNINRITEKGTLKSTSTGKKRRGAQIETQPSISDENKLKKIVRQVVQSEIHRKRSYEYITVDIIEKSGYWAWIEDGEENYLTDDDDVPNSTLDDVLDYFGSDGWRCVQLMNETQNASFYWSLGGGKHFVALFEKAL